MNNDFDEDETVDIGADVKKSHTETNVEPSIEPESIEPVEEAEVEPEVKIPAPTVKKTPAKKTTATKKTPVKKVEEEAVEMEEAEPVVKKAPAKKAAPAKATAPKAVKLFVEYQGGQVSTQDIAAKAAEASGKKTIKELNVYYQPETNMVYYTADGTEGSFSL